MSVKDLLRHYESGKCINDYLKFTAKEKELNRSFYDSQTAVHNALCGEGVMFGALNVDPTGLPAPMQILLTHQLS